MSVSLKEERYARVVARDGADSITIEVGPGIVSFWVGGCDAPSRLSRVDAKALAEFLLKALDVIQSWEEPRKEPPR